MATLTSPAPDPRPTTRRTVGLLIGLAVELLLLGALAVAAWAGSSEDQPPLSFADGFWNLVIFGGLAGVFVLFAALSFVSTRQWYGALVAAVLMAIAGFIGFFGFLLISLSRQETSDC